MQASQDRAGERTDEIDLGGLWALIVRRRARILAPTLAAFIGAAFYVQLATPRYTAESRVLLEVQDPYTPRGDRADASGGQGIDSEAVGSQVQLVTSRDLARRVVKQLELVGNPEFDPLAKGLGLVSRMMVLAGLKRDPTSLSPEDRVLDAYFEKLTVFSPSKTRVLNVEFQSSDPDLAARGANTIVDAYLGFQQDAKRENARQAAASLGAQVTDLKLRVADAEAKVEDFRSRSGLYLGANNLSLNSQQLGEVNTELSRARAQQADGQAKARLIREMVKQGRIGEIPDVANNDLVRRISEQRVTLKGQIAFESRTLLPGHPRMKEMSAQLADLEGELRAAAEKTARTLENDARLAGARVENLQTTLTQQKKVMGESSADEVQLRDLERSARLLKDELEATTTKYQEALAAQNAKSITADARVISRALAPQAAAFPKKLPIIAFASIAAFVLSLGGVLAAQLLSTPAPGAPGLSEGAAAKRDDEPSEGASAVAPSAAFLSAGHNGDDEPLMAAIDRDDAARADLDDSKAEHTEADRAVAALKAAFAGAASAAIAREALGAGGQILVVAATDGPQDDGFALALGRELAREARVVLVAMGEGVGLPHQTSVGLGDLASGAAGFSQALHRDRVSRLHFMGPGAAPDDAHALAPTLDALGQAYDVVLVGAPRDLSVEDAAALAGRAALAVVFAHDPAAAQRLADALENAGVPQVALASPPAKPEAGAAA